MRYSRDCEEARAASSFWRIGGGIRRKGTLDFLVAAYAAALPFQVEVQRGVLNFALADCCLALILLVAAGQLKYRKPAWTIWHLGLVFAFASASFLTALRTAQLSRYVVMNKDLGLLLLFLSYAAVTSVVTDWQDVRRILRIFLASVVLQNVVAVAAFLVTYLVGVQTPFTAYGGKRLSGMLIDPNAYGGILVMALAICEGASWGAKPLVKGPKLLFYRLTLGMGILFTFSRSSWASLFLAMLLFCVVRRRVPTWMTIAALIVAPSALLLKGTRFLGFVENMAGRAERGETRFGLIEAAWNQFAQHPLFGGGIGSFVAHEGTIPHNTALWFLADFGIVGLVAMFGLLGWFLFKGWSAYRLAPEEERPIMLGLLMAHTAMVGLAMGIEASYQRHWWFVLALIASSCPLAQQYARNQQQESSHFSLTVRQWKEQARSGSYTS
jgi:putative inorganic carbon (HCO3(-)) transporter